MTNRAAADLVAPGAPPLAHELHRLRIFRHPVAPHQVVQQSAAFLGNAGIGIDSFVRPMFIDERLPLARLLGRWARRAITPVSGLIRRTGI